MSKEIKEKNILRKKEGEGIGIVKIRRKVREGKS